MAKQYVLGIRLTDRVQKATEMQKVLTECGCYIKTRLGLHEVNDNVCSPSGLIILELFGGDAAILAMEKKLQSIEGLQVQKMVFED
jgi:hypothetical protein